jgi:cytochrome c553
MKAPSILTILASLCISNYAQSQASVEIGQEKSQACVGCHGVKGKAFVPIYPNLAGQNAAYLESSLKAYRAKTRKGSLAETMYFVAAGLSDSDIESIAAYYSQIEK